MILRPPAILPTTVPLSEADRMRRIGAWVCRAARLVEPDAPAAPPASVLRPDDGAPAERVLAYLRARPEASPLEIRLSLGLSRSMAYRALQQLQACGLVAASGRTKSQVYRATPADPSRN